MLVFFDDQGVVTYQSLTTGKTHYDQAVEAMGLPDRLVFSWEPEVGRFIRLEFDEKGILVRKGLREGTPRTDLEGQLSNTILQ